MKRVRNSFIILSLMLILAACGKDNGTNSGDQNPPGRAPSRGGETDVITDLRTILESQSPSSLVGRQVLLDQVLSHDVYWAVFTITQGRSDKMPVAVAVKLSGHDDAGRHHVKKDELLRIGGTIESAPAYDPGNPFWRGVGPQGRALIERIGIYINATQIEPSFGRPSWAEKNLG